MILRSLLLTCRPLTIPNGPRVQMSILRDIKRAKSLLRAVGNIRMFTVSSGKAVVKQGDPGDSMYTVAEVCDVIDAPVRIKYFQVCDRV